MAMITATVTLNPAFLQEIKEDNQRLRGLTKELHDAFSHGRPEGLSRHELGEKLGQFRDQLATHFALEEAFGYFEDPIAAAPRLNEQAQALRAQHAELFALICSIFDEADELFRRHVSPEAFSDLGFRFVDFELQLQEHEARENALIMQAFNDDIGVGD